MADASPELLSHGVEPDDDGARRPTGRGVALLSGALVVSLVCSVVLAVLLYRDQQRETRERAVVDVVNAYTGAWNAHDLTAVRATMTESATFVSGESLAAPLIEPVEQRELDELFRRVFRSDAALETTGSATVIDGRGYRVAVPQRISYVVQGLPVTEDGLSLFTVVRTDEGLRIVQHFWWRPYHGKNPSMLWTG